MSDQLSINEPWAVISEYRDDHTLFDSKTIESLHDDQAEAEDRARDLQQERGFEKSDGGDGIERQRYYAAKLRLLGQQVVKTVVTVTTTEFADEQGRTFTRSARTESPAEILTN